jgi:hypothetical protein
MQNSLAMRRIRLGLLAIVLLLSGSLLAAAATPAAGAARLSSSKAKSAVVKYVKKRYGADYKVHPACYSLSSKQSKCLVHMVHNSASCTKYATVKLKGGRTLVSMKRPSC